MDEALQALEAEVQALREENDSKAALVNEINSELRELAERDYELQSLRDDEQALEQQKSTLEGQVLTVKTTINSSSKIPPSLLPSPPLSLFSFFLFLYLSTDCRCQGSHR